MNNIEIDKLKKSFLDGEVTASEYEGKIEIIKKEIKEREASKVNNENIVNSDVNNVDSYKFVVAGILLVLATIFIFTIYIVISKPKSQLTINTDSNINTVPTKSKKQIAEEDSLYKIEAKKRQKEYLAEEAAFMKTKAGRIYKKNPEWSREDCEKLANDKIWIGMDIDMLKYSNGRPTSANPSNYGNGVTQWQWCWSDYNPSCYYDNDGDGKIDSYN